MISMGGQANALGQVAGGPALGAIGTMVSLRAAMATSGALLLPALALFRVALRRPEALPEPPTAETGAAAL